MIRECIHCEGTFDTDSPAKKRAGGRINECPECTGEDVPRYLGVASGDGKMASISILAFNNKADREQYKAFWQNNSGLHKGKECQLGSHTSVNPGINFRTVTQSGAMNHKGRL
jgi:NAD-dependent SIR2 family protein deacetylase